MNKSKILSIVTASCAVGALGLSVANYVTDKQVILNTSNGGTMGMYASNTGAIPGATTDFTNAAESSVHAVVHVKKTSKVTTYANDPFFDFFGGGGFSPFGSPREQEQQSTGSGVIISPDGYIVTNNHVVAKGEKVNITLNDKKEYEATVVGTDPSTDLAVLKIEANNLPYLTFGNSDNAKIGEWVLAVGNPFELNSTVTAGIISAKARSINILGNQSNTPIESFIQTDAAVNPGNSGGALVNLKGELIGINTAIATPTGTYAGYSFAVPVNIVKKIVEDIMEFGTVQRGFLGVSIANITSDMAKEFNLDNLDGIYVAGVNEGSGAQEAGLEVGDVIIAINGVEVKSSPALQEQVSKYRPGNTIKVDIIRKGKKKVVEVVLKNRANTTSIIKKETTEMALALGVQLRNLTEKEVKDYKVSGGVSIDNIGEGIISKNTNIKQGFVITKVDHKRVNTVQEFEDILNRKSIGDGVLIEGFYPQYRYKTLYYAFGL